MVLEETVTLTKTEEILPHSRSVCYVILTPNLAKYVGQNMPTSQTKLLGKTMLEWVINACGDRPAIVDISPEEDNLVKVIRPYLKDADWTVVLYSDTPLISSIVLESAVDFAESKDQNVLKLERGYVCKTEYLKSADVIYGMEEFRYNKNDFLRVSTFADCNLASKTIKNRIMDYFLENGVQIIDPDTTYIESGVSIGAGSVVYPNNELCGNTEIGNNVQLFGGNRILNSIVSADAKIEGSSIVSSVIGAKSRIKNSVIGSDALIKSNCKIIDGASVKESVVDEECKIIGASVKGAYINKNCKIYDGARISGSDGNITLLNNVSVMENAVIARPCEIKEGAKVDAGAIIK